FIISLLFYRRSLAITLIVIVFLVAIVDALFQMYDVYPQHDAFHLTIKEYVFMASYVFTGFLVMSVAFAQTFNHLHLQYLRENKKLKESKSELLDYKEKLEHLVEIRTEELRHSNQELIKQQEVLENSNEELNVTNEELYHQREYLEEAMKKLKKAQKQLIQSEKMVSLGTLSAGIAHEINNPLNYITSSAVILKQQLSKFQHQQLIPEKNSKVLSKLFASIETGSERLVSIVKGLNEYARQSGNEINECCLHHIIDNCLNILLHEYRNRIEIHKNFAEKEICFLSNNEALHQIFTNILVNAMQAIKKEGTIKISTSIQPGEKIRITFQDSGIGMDADTQRKIFDPFFTTKPPGKGTGLGLSIVYEAIKQLNGDIRVESELNKGAEFKISIPYKPVSND
ncbi:MAG: ATP-binding protein, partial [Bacteroidales bacterium]|nr:ATP-binding protein [Bacteroidales bacterium]